MDPYVLFYSQACPKCDQLFDMHKTNPIFSNLKPFCIDGLRMLPKYVQYTPTLRITDQQGYHFLIGDQILQWIDTMMKQNNQMANSFEQDPSLVGMDSAFENRPEKNPKKNLNDMYKIDSGYNGMTPQAQVENKMTNFDMDERMRQMQAEMKDLNPKYQQQTVELPQETSEENELNALFQNTSGQNPPRATRDVL